MPSRPVAMLVLILLAVATAQNNRSVEGEVRTNIEFLNTHDAPIEVFWVNYEGEEQLRFELPSGGSLDQPTFVTHPWRAKTMDGEVLLTITAIRRAQQAVVPCAQLREVAESDRPPKLNPDSPPARLGTDLSCVDLRESDLSASNLLGANLLGSSLRAANLSASVLRNADLRGADLRGANLQDADLTGANLIGAQGLEGDAILCGALADDTTRWPDGFNIELHRNCPR